MKRYICLSICLTYLAILSAQTWTIKSLPVVIPTSKMTVMVLRFGLQLATTAIYTRNTWSYGRYPQSRYHIHYNLNLGTRHYFGQKSLNKSWFLGMNAWFAIGNKWSKEPISYIVNSNDTFYEYGGRNRYSALGAVMGKNFSLGKRWFIETKICVERINEEYSKITSSNNEPLTHRSFYQSFIFRPSMLVVYRLK
jgi:hypothetical protein